MSNTIERAILLADGSVIQKENVTLPKINVISPPEKAPQSLRLSEGQEKSLIYQALEKNLWIQKDAAKELGITPRALNYRIKKLGITHARWRKHR
jgi:two-component system response regulator AtoC